MSSQKFIETSVQTYGRSRADVGKGDEWDLRDYLDRILPEETPLAELLRLVSDAGLEEHVVFFDDDVTIRDVLTEVLFQELLKQVDAAGLIWHREPLPPWSSDDGLGDVTLDASGQPSGSPANYSNIAGRSFSDREAPVGYRELMEKGLPS